MFKIRPRIIELAEHSEYSVKDLISTDNLVEDNSSKYKKVGVLNYPIAEESVLFSKVFSSINFGSYSFILKVKVSDISFKTEILKFSFYSNEENGEDILIKEVVLTPQLIGIANEWVYVGKGFFFNGNTPNAMLKMKITQMANESTLSCYLDTFKIVPTGVAITGIG